jgi:hypothetical protein
MSEIKKRWYDIDPVVSSAVNRMEKTHEDTQIICAEYILDKLKDIDFEMSLDEQYNYILRRWYDKNIKVSHAMEYLKHAPEELRHQIAVDILNYINEQESLEEKIKNDM